MNKWHPWNLPKPGNYKHKDNDSGKPVVSKWKYSIANYQFYYCPLCKKITTFRPNVLSRTRWYCTNCNQVEIDKSMTYEDLKKMYEKKNRGNTN